MEKKISIIIPVYNGENYLEKCIAGILHQTYHNFEAVFVDDGSTDQSLSIIQKYAKIDQRIVWYQQKNAGASAARNTGIQKASGDYIYFCDIDDEVDENLLKDNMKLAQEHQADLVMFCFDYFNLDTNVRIPNGMQKGFCGTKEDFFKSFVENTIEREVINPPWNKLIKRSFLEKHQLLFNVDIYVYEDMDFAIHMLQYAERIVVNPKNYYIYMVRKNGSLITKFQKNCFAGLSQIYQKALDYCGLFQNNEKQLASFANVYVKYSYNYLKQISCEKSLSRKEKYQLIREITTSELFRDALDRIDLQGRKKRMASLIRKDRYRFICFLYQLRKFMEQRL